MGINRVTKRGKSRIEVRKRWPDGTTFRRWFPNMTVAKRVLTHIEASIHDGSWSESRKSFYQDFNGDGATIEKLSKRFLEEYAKPRLRSWDRYELSLRTINRDLGNLPIDQLKRDVVYRWMKKRAEEVSAASTNRDIAALKKMYSWAHEIGVLDENPLVKFRLFKEEIKERRPLRFKEYIRLINSATDEMLRTFLVILGETGCRRSEALHLKLNDLDFDSENVTFNRVKNRKARIVPMSPRLKGALHTLRDSFHFTSQYVLVNSHTGKRLVDPKKGFHAIANRAGVPWLAVHDLRRFRATQWAMAGVPVHTIQKLLGHQHLQTTMRYLQHRDASFETVRRAFERENEVGENWETATDQAGGSSL